MESDTMRNDTMYTPCDSAPPTAEVKQRYAEIRAEQSRLAVGRRVLVERGLAKDQRPFEGVVDQVEQRAYGLRVVLKVQGRRRGVVVCGDQCHVPAARRRA